MSRIYDNWEKLVGAVLKREDLRRLARCDSFSSSISTDYSSRPSLDSGQHAASRSSSQKFRDLSSENIVSRNVVIEYEEIRKATKNFEADMLGNGGSGPVYKGWIDEHRLTAVKPGSGVAVAVKKVSYKLGTQVRHSEWADEIHYLCQLHHPNLVKLIGYSFNTYNRILVYEFMPKGSLDNHLFKRGHQWLPWATRIKVAVGAARALAFLHAFETPIIHRDIKCSHILLDASFNTKLSDFGLPVDGPTANATLVSAPAVATYGYAAPEYVATGNLTTRCDVYSFGVVLVELISGLRVIDRNRPHGKHNMMDWARPFLTDKTRFSLFMDSRLEGQNLYNEAYKVAKIALQCVSFYPRIRPTMAEIVAALEQL